MPACGNRSGGLEEGTTEPVEGGLRGLRFDGEPVAEELVAPRQGPAAIGEREVDEADRLDRTPSGRSRDAGDGEAEVGSRKPAHPLGHGPRGLRADRPEAPEHRVGDRQVPTLQVVVVRDERSAQVAGAP